MNTRCPPKRVPSAACFFTLCKVTVQPPQSYSVGGQRSSGQLTGKPAGARPDYRGRWCAEESPGSKAEGSRSATLPAGGSSGGGGGGGLMGEMSAILARRRKATDKGEKVVPKKEEESDDSDSPTSKPLTSSDSIRRPWEKAATMPRAKSVTTSSNSTEGPSPDDSDLDRMKQVQHSASHRYSTVHLTGTAQGTVYLTGTAQGRVYLTGTAQGRVYRTGTAQCISQGTAQGTVYLTGTAQCISGTAQGTVYLTGTAQGTVCLTGTAQGTVCLTEGSEWKKTAQSISGFAFTTQPVVVMEAGPSVQAELEFRGAEFSVRVSSGAELLEVEVSDMLSADQWRGQFDSAYIEDLTRKTGNFKQFAIFCSMLESALTKSSESVTLDLLTYSDLELLRNRKAGLGSRPRPSSKSPALNAKRYLILIYSVEFDRIHYPLPLPYQGKPDPARLQREIRELREELRERGEGGGGCTHLLVKLRQEKEVLAGALERMQAEGS
ncbi:UNVERIFIED_CONTAM: hypothetical protein FKN15_029198 [Acipenser sinensis]